MSEPAAAAAGPRPSSARSKARKRALDILFESELRGTDPLQTLTERAADPTRPMRDHTAALVEGVHAHAEVIDARIAGALRAGWTLPRLPRVDRIALRIATYELDYTDLPPAVVVSEAVRLVSELSTDDSPAFVQGVLGALTSTRQA